MSQSQNGDLWYENYIPESKSGDWAVSHFSVSKDQSMFSALRGYLSYVPEGSYMKLTRSGSVVMSNTRMEYNTNREIIKNGTGNVLIAGLGLGLVVRELLLKEDVLSILIVEKNEDVINLVSPYLIDNRIKIIHKDIFEFKTKDKFDSMWFDIWDGFCTDNLPEMSKLHRKFARNWTRIGFRGSWGQKECQKKKRQDKNRYSFY